MSSLLLICKTPSYEKATCVRGIVTVLCYIWMSMYVMGGIFSFFLVYFSSSIVSATVSAYTGYFIVINATGIPSSVYIIFHETSSQAGTKAAAKPKNLTHPAFLV